MYFFTNHDLQFSLVDKQEIIDHASMLLESTVMFFFEFMFTPKIERPKAHVAPRNCRMPLAWAQPTLEGGGPRPPSGRPRDAPVVGAELVIDPLVVQIFIRAGRWIFIRIFQESINP